MIENLGDLVRQMGVELYDCEQVSENSRNIWRVYITKQGGVSLDDCEKVSRLLSPIYDVNPPILGEWVLEVSSPGLERKLTKLKHFASSIDENVKISLNDKNIICGKILSVNDEIIEILAEDEKIQINFNNIKKAKTFMQW